MGPKGAASTGEGAEQMGRGRAKAKQTKVARDLKYSTHNLDLERLQRELGGDSAPAGEDDVTAEVSADT
ncbi:DUF3073 domain-containing protein [Streptosporangium sp. NPDC004631]